LRALKLLENQVLNFLISSLRYNIEIGIIFFTEMGRGKHCTPEKRDLIKKLILEGKTYAEIQNYIGCSPTMIRNALKYESKSETRERKPAMSPKLIRRMVRQFRSNPFMPATQIKNNLNIQASIETVRRHLREHNLTIREKYISYKKACGKKNEICEGAFRLARRKMEKYFVIGRE